MNDRMTEDDDDLTDMLNDFYAVQMTVFIEFGIDIRKWCARDKLYEVEGREIKKVE